MANTARLAYRRFDTISLIKILLCFYLTIAAPYSYAIDPITGAWTANAAASAAFGGGASGGAAALTAAVEAAAGAASTAAAAAGAAALVAGAGVAAYCATSWASGSNGCGANPFGASTGIPAALSAAGITLDPQNGRLVTSGATYFTSTAYSVVAGEVCFTPSKTEVAVCLQPLVQAKYAQNWIVKTETLSTTDCLLRPYPDVANCGTIQVSRAPNTNPNSFSNMSTQPSIFGYTGTSVATDAEVAAAVAASPKARAAAAAATAAPSVTAADAAAAAATAAPRTAEAECAAKGMKHGTFNGAVFCVGTGAGIDGTGAAEGETGTGEGTGTGTGTGNPPTTGTSTPPFVLPAFCTWAETMCSWFNWTKEEPATANPAQNKVDIKDRQTSDIPGLPTTIDTSRIQWAQVCPAPITANFSLMGQSVGMSYKFDVVCDFAAKFRPYVIGLSYLTGAYIVMGLNRTRSE